MKVVHLSTVHPATDTRILYNEATALVRHGYEVSVLAVADSNSCVSGVNVLALPRYRRRFRRVMFSLFGVWKYVSVLKPDVIHFHDPELLPGAAFMRLFGISVIYDAHEELRKDVLLKGYLPKAVRKLVSMLVGALEGMLARCMTGVVAATPAIAEQFPSRMATVVQNFPDLNRSLFNIGSSVNATGTFRCLYIGSISRERGVIELLEALVEANRAATVRLDLAGKFQSETDELESRTHPGWHYVDYHGWVGGARLEEICQRAELGLVNLHKTESHMRAYPIKLFEYMAMSLPAVVSNIPLWKEIVEEARAGIVIDPTDVSALVSAILRVAEDRDFGRALGENGRRAAEEKYNWSIESRKLEELYAHVSIKRRGGKRRG